MFEHVLLLIEKRSCMHMLIITTLSVIIHIALCIPMCVFHLYITKYNTT